MNFLLDANTSQQWACLETAINLCLAEEAAGHSLINRVVEVWGMNDLTAYFLPLD